MDSREAEDDWYLLWQREASDLLEWTGRCGSEDSWKWACQPPILCLTEKMRLARWFVVIPFLHCSLLLNSGLCLLLGGFPAGGWCPLVP